MISGLLLASYSFFGGGAFGDLLTKWDQMGFFSYVLPFLLVFSVVFGVLSKTRIFDENKSVNAIIALVVGFMSLQWDLVPRFFSELFPRVGVGLSILLVFIIFLGIFLPRQNWAIYLSLGIASIIVISILLNSSEAMGWQNSFFAELNWSYILVTIIVIACLIAVIASGKEKTHAPFDSISPAFFSDMHRR
jgi:hypothetical protein